MMLRLQEATSCSASSPVPSTDDYSSDTSLTSVELRDDHGDDQCAAAGDQHGAAGAPAARPRLIAPAPARHPAPSPT